MDWIYWTRLVHTLVFFIASACIVYLVYCGIAGKAGPFLMASLGIVFTVGIINAFNNFECPLATSLHQLAGRRDIPCIFFPDWFTNEIMTVSSVVYLIGVVSRHKTFVAETRH